MTSELAFNSHFLNWKGRKKKKKKKKKKKTIRETETYFVRMYCSTRTSNLHLMYRPSIINYQVSGSVSVTFLNYLNITKIYSKQANVVCGSEIPLFSVLKWLILWNSETDGCISHAK
jgi:hypothetical protein